MHNDPSCDVWPNITGAFYTIAGSLSTKTAPSGAFTEVSNSGVNAGAVWFDTATSGEQKQSFDLSSGNSVYANNCIVQSASLHVLVVIKI